MPTNNISPCILFVDDEEITRKYFEKAFNKEFYVLTAESVAQARGILQENSEEICVLVTDQRMPEANGVELLNFARDNYPHIVRLLTTGYSDLNDAIAAVNKGEILRYIEKPWNLQAFSAELRNALRFYYLQNERDQLLQEKLSIRHRLTEINRVRDLIVWASAVMSLNHADRGIRSILLQAPVSINRSIEVGDLELWGALEQEIHEMLDLAKSLKEKISCDAPGRFTEFSLNDLTADFLDCEPVTTINNLMAETKNCKVSLSVELFKILLISMQDFFEARDCFSLKAISIDATEDENFVSITFNCDPATKSGQPDFSIDSNLLAVFLICAHHGGNTRLIKNSSVGVELRLPFVGTSLPELQNNDQWLEQILSRYEVDTFQ